MDIGYSEIVNHYGPAFVKNAARHEDTWGRKGKNVYAKSAGAVKAAGFVFSDVWRLYWGMEKAVVAGKV